MFRAWLALGAFCCAAAWAGAPSYSAAGILNNGDGSPGPFAPNSILSIYGTDLAISPHVLSPADLRGNTLPLELNSTRVYVDNTPVPLYFVSENQINFLIPSKQSLGPAVVHVTREGLTGPMVKISITDAAPALLADGGGTGYAIASHRDLITLVSPNSPARPGEIVILWATGLGKTMPNPQTGELPPYLAEIVNRPNLKITLGGVPVGSAGILYAGLSPGYAGLYQINFQIPAECGADPEIRVSIGDQSTAAGLKLAVH